MGRGNNSGSRDSRRRESSGGRGGGFSQDMSYMSDFRPRPFRDDAGSDRRVGGGGSFVRDFSAPREMHTATCADCGKECQVPFKPIEGRPVYCRECYPKHKKF